MDDFTAAFIRIGLLEDPDPLAPYYGKSLTELPKLVLEMILMMTDPGDPEALRETCKTFNKLYEEHEGNMPMRKQPGTSMYLGHDETGLRVQISGRAKGHQYDLEVVKPTKKQLTRFFRTAGEITFGPFTLWPVVFQGQFPGMHFKTLLAKQDFTVVYLKTLDPIITRYVLEMFEDTSKLQWFTNEEEASTIDIDDLQDIQYMTSLEPISNQTLQRVLENHRTLKFVRLTLHSDFDHYKYVDEWYEGTRSLTKWQLLFPDDNYYEFDEVYRKGECDCRFICVGERCDDIFSLYLGCPPCEE